MCSENLAETSGRVLDNVSNDATSHLGLDDSTLLRSTFKLGFLWKYSVRERNLRMSFEVPAFQMFWLYSPANLFRLSDQSGLWQLISLLAIYISIVVFFSLRSFPDSYPTWYSLFDQIYISIYIYIFGLKMFVEREWLGDVGSLISSTNLIISFYPICGLFIPIKSPSYSLWGCIFPLSLCFLGKFKSVF
jgi:hypothetical protein